MIFNNQAYCNPNRSKFVVRNVHKSAYVALTNLTGTEINTRFHPEKVNMPVSLLACTPHLYSSQASSFYIARF